MAVKMRPRTNTNFSVGSTGETEDSFKWRNSRDTSSGEYDEDTGGRKHEALTLESFEQLAVLGEGGFGKVLMVRKKTSNKIYALKAMA
eukprot:6047749-Prymnesium_polylepis.1